MGSRTLIRLLAASAALAALKAAEKRPSEDGSQTRPAANGEGIVGEAEDMPTKTMPQLPSKEGR